MAVNKLFPKNQQYIDLRDGNIISISKVKLIGAANDTDFVVLGSSVDATLLNDAVTDTDPTFYLSGNNDSIFNIDVTANHPAGTEFIVVARHSGNVNFIESD